MSAFGNSFTKGLDQGEQAYYRAMEFARQKKLDERADRDDARKQADQARVDESFANLENVNSGIGDQGQQLKDAYGVTPKQIQAGIKEGGIGGLRSKLSNYDTPDSYDLQGAAPGTAAPLSGAEGFDGSTLPDKAAPGGVKPRYTADKLQEKQATDLDKEKALGAISIAKREEQGIRSSQALQKGLEFEQEFKGHLVGFTGSPEQMKRVSESIHTASPNIQVSTRDEQGFVTMSVTKPDKTKDVFRMSPQQQATLYAGANMFNKDPERSMKIMGSINASLGEVLKNESESIFKVTKENREGRLGAAHERYYDAASDSMKIKANAAADKVLMTVDKFAPEDQSALKSIVSEKDRVHGIMMKGIAESTLTPDNPAYINLKKQYDILTFQERGVYKKYSQTETPKPPSPGGAAPSGDPKDSAPIRNNNPGAMMPGGKLAVYKTPEEGIAALDGNLKRYGDGGINTIAGVISKWAPPNENDTAAYISAVASRLGIPANQKIDLSNPYTRHALSGAIMIHENGNKTVFKPGATPAAGGVTPSSNTSQAASANGPGINPSTQPASASATAPAAGATRSPYTAGRPTVSPATQSQPARATAPATQAAAEPVGRSPQSMGDDFESLPSRTALMARVKDAANGGEPLSRIEALRARQLKLIA